jgi:ribosomal subunit interface protein
MHLKYKFKNLKQSNELTDYIQQKFEKLEKYEMKPVTVSVTLCVEKDERRVDIHACGEKLTMQAHGVSDNFLESIDVAVERLAKQMMKRKSKVQNHKCFERTHLGKIEQLSPGLEWRPLQQDSEEQDAA